MNGKKGGGLDSGRWKEMWALFEQAIVLPMEERPAFVKESCDDPLIRKTLEELLAVDAKSLSFLEQPVIDGLPEPGTRLDPPSAGPQPRTPDRLGPYRLLHQVGQGGMGTVFLAVRDDDTFQRRVVVKLVRRGMESEDALRRLRTERQILASLDHPHIAELFDGGTTEDQLPYFVMEYVEGVPIDAYCDLNQLSIDERLILFRKVCDAVHYAHQNLVVHRDLKPSNILVTADGQPKLLDFGIAKVLNPELSSPELAPTATWQRMLTPHYASPEQIRGKLVTTGSDVYSLGVLLYKLLTGRLPFRFERQSPHEIEQILTQTDPPRPSTVVAGERLAGEAVQALPGKEPTTAEISQWRSTTPAELRRRLAGDLDSILLKALRSTPQQRYRSVEQLDADLDRYQKGLAVEARQGTWRYRAGKFIGRKRTVLAVSVSTFVLLLAFAAAMAWQSARVTRERDQARLESAKKESVLQLMLDVFGVNDPTLSDGEKASMTVGEALARSGGLLDRRLRKHPDLRAEILHATGTIYFNLGLHEQARAQLEESLELRRALFGDQHRDSAETLSALSNVVRDQGEMEEAEVMGREALEILRDPDIAESPEDLLDPINTLVTTLCARGDYETAEPLAREGMALARELEGRDKDLAFFINSAAAARSAAGDYRESAALYRQSLALLETVWGQGHLTLVAPLNNLGVSLRLLGDPRGAVEAYAQALEVQRRALGDEHPNLAPTYNNLAAAEFMAEDYASALEHYRDSLRILRQSFGADNLHGFMVEIRVQATRGRLGEVDAAERELRELITRLRTRMPEGHWSVSIGESTLGEVLTTAGRYEEAEPLLVNSYLALLGQSRHRRKKDALDRLVKLYEILERPEEIERYRGMLDSPEA